MKSILIVLFVVCIHSLNAQLSISGGYIRRTEGRKVNLPSHFGVKPSSANNLYNFANFQVTYQSKPHLEVVGKLGFSLLNKSDYYGRQEISWGSSSTSYHSTTIFTSDVNYSLLSLGFGLNRLFLNPKSADKRLKIISSIGFLFQTELFLHYKESIHKTEYFKEQTIYTGPNAGTSLVDHSTSDTSFRSLTKTFLFSNLGLAISERFVFKSTYFLELKLNFSIATTNRLTTPLREVGSDNDVFTNFPIDEHRFIPILETGIGIGYIFPAKKKKST